MTALHPKGNDISVATSKNLHKEVQRMWNIFPMKMVAVFNMKCMVYIVNIRSLKLYNLNDTEEVIVEAEIILNYYNLL